MIQSRVSANPYIPYLLEVSILPAPATTVTFRNRLPVATTRDSSRLCTTSALLMSSPTTNNTSFKTNSKAHLSFSLVTHSSHHIRLISKSMNPFVDPFCNASHSPLSSGTFFSSVHSLAPSLHSGCNVQYHCFHSWVKVCMFLICGDDVISLLFFSQSETASGQRDISNTPHQMAW